MKKTLKNKKLIISSIVTLLIIATTIYFFSKEDKIEYNFSLAERQNLIQEISSTGRVKAVDELNLAFEKGGKIETVNIRVGDKVKKGQALVWLESDDILAEISQARAGVASAKAKLSQYEAVLEKEESELKILEIGTRDEEIVIYDSKVQNAEAVYSASVQNLTDSIGDAYTKADDAIRNKIDSTFSDPRTTNPQLIFNISDSQLEIDIEWGRSLIEQQLIAWVSSLRNMDQNPILDEVIKTENRLSEIKSFLSKMALAVSELSVNSSLSQTTIDSYKTNIYNARININTAITNLSLYKEKFNIAQISLLIAENELTLKEAKSTPEKINSQQATIKQAEANIEAQKAEIDLKESLVQSSLVKLSKNVLESPIDGTITKKKADVGTIVSGGEIIVSIISGDNLEIESNIVEADIAYLKVGDKAKLSLDAYGEDLIFNAEVIEIEPAGQLIEGVANYRITLGFTEKDERIKAGMTADLDIITMELKGVIAVPYRAIIFRNGSERIIRILKENNLVEESLVEIGIIGNGSLVEIISGVNEGDQVITSVKSNK